MNDSRGPGCVTPRTPPNQPHWWTATVAPNAAPTDSRNPPVATSGTTMRAEHEREDEQGEPDDDEQVGRQGAREPLGDLDVGDRGAGQAGVGAGVSVEGVRRELEGVHGLDGGRVGGTGGGHDLEGQGVLVLAHPERDDAADAVDVPQGGGDAGLVVEHLGVRAGGVLRGQRRLRDDGTVGAGAELRRDGRVRRVRGGPGRLAAAVGEPELDPRDGDGHHPEQGDDTDQREPRLAGHEAYVPGAVLLLAVPVGDLLGRQVTRRREPRSSPCAARHHTGSHEPQHRRAHGDGDEHRDGHGGGRDENDLGEDRDRRAPAPQGDDDGGTGEHDGVAGGRHGPCDRPARSMPRRTLPRCRLTMNRA